MGLSNFDEELIIIENICSLTGYGECGVTIVYLKLFVVVMSQLGIVLCRTHTIECILHKPSPLGSDKKIRIFYPDLDSMVAI